MQSKTILAYGATGVQGSAAIRQLQQAGFAVRGVVRDEKEAAQVEALGVEAAIGNFEDADSLIAASQGVDGVFLVLPLIYDYEVVMRYARHAIDAARAARVSYLVFNTSTRIPDEITSLVSFESKRDVEAYLRASGIPSLSIRPPFYMENFVGPWTAPAIVQQSVVAYPVPSPMRASWISQDDMGRLAAEAFRQMPTTDQPLNIGGPDVLTGADISERFSQAFGKPVHYHTIPTDEFEVGLSYALGAEVAGHIANMYRYMETNHETDLFITDTQALLAVLPVTLTPLETWVRQQPWNDLVPAAPAQ